MNEKRVYEVCGPNNSKTLVEAATRQQAVNRVVSVSYKARPLQSSELLAAINAGTKVLQPEKAPEGAQGSQDAPQGAKEEAAEAEKPQAV